MLELIAIASDLVDLFDVTVGSGPRTGADDRRPTRPPGWRASRARRSERATSPDAEHQTAS